jgi:hypothetical protein
MTRPTSETQTQLTKYRECVMLGAALASKHLRAQLRADDFEREDAQLAIAEMKRMDAGEVFEPTKLPALMRNLGIEIEGKQASIALLDAVTFDGRKRRLTRLAESIRIASITDDKTIDEYLSKLSEV